MGDLADQDALARGLRGATAAVHLAAQLHVNSPSPELHEMYRQTNVEGTRRVVELATDADVDRIVLASTINVYGARSRRAPVTESDAPDPESIYAETKLQAEEIVRGAASGVVLRVAAVVGPGMKGNYPTLQRALGAGLPILPGDGSNRRTLVHLRDVSSAFALAAAGGVPRGTFNLTDGSVHRFDDVVRSLQVSAGRNPGVRYVSAASVRAALRPLSFAAQRSGRRFDIDSLLEKMVEDVAVAGNLLIDRTTYVSEVETLTAWRLPS